MVTWQSPAYCTCLENKRGLKASVGSNPTVTAIFGIMLWERVHNLNDRIKILRPMKIIVAIQSELCYYTKIGGLSGAAIAPDWKSGKVLLAHVGSSPTSSVVLWVKKQIEKATQP